MRVSFLLGIPLCAVWSISATGQVGTVHSRIQGIEIPSIPNAPFAAKIAVTWDEPLAGGGTVSRKYYTMVARDSQGRVHRETRGFVRGDSNEEPPLQSVTILDPVSGTRTVCKQALMTCARGAFHPRLELPDASGALVVSNNNNVSRENLGQRMMFGLSVSGTRETDANVAGTHGSSRLALSQTETWYSQDLHMAMSVIRNNPQMGQVTLTVTELTRAEPDASWFAPPSGFEMKSAQSK
jgi:hypothetical protein